MFVICSLVAFSICWAVCLSLVRCESIRKWIVSLSVTTARLLVHSLMLDSFAHFLRILGGELHLGLACLVHDCRNTARFVFVLHLSTKDLVCLSSTDSCRCLPSDGKHGMCKEPVSCTKLCNEALVLL